uniref:Acidic endochitinase n=1 Tax=Lygus hesperus TaxID=30085 RepID=A0A0A9Y1F9_LYGHE
MHYTTDVPCLLAVDNLNCVDQSTEYLHPTHYTNLRGRDLAAPYLLLQSLRRPPRYGATIAALTSNATMRSVDDYVFLAGFNHQVCGYSSREMQCALEHYSISRAIHLPLTVPTLRAVEATTGSVPADLRSWCEMY